MKNRVLYLEVFILDFSLDVNYKEYTLKKFKPASWLRNKKN